MSGIMMMDTQKERECDYIAWPVAANLMRRGEGKTWKLN